MTNEIKYIRVSNELYHYGMPRRSGRYPYGSGDRPYQSSGGTVGGVSSKDQKTSWRAKRLKKVQEKAAKKEAKAREKEERAKAEEKYFDMGSTYDNAISDWAKSSSGKKAIEEYNKVYERVFNSDWDSPEMWDDFYKAEEKYLRAEEQAGIKALIDKYSDEDILFYANYNNHYGKYWRDKEAKTVQEALEKLEDEWKLHTV